MTIKTLKQYSREKEIAYIRDIQAYFRGDVSKTARALGVDRKTIYNKLHLSGEKIEKKVLLK